MGMTGATVTLHDVTLHNVTPAGDWSQRSLSSRVTLLEGSRVTSERPCCWRVNSRLTLFSRINVFFNSRKGFNWHSDIGEKQPKHLWGSNPRESYSPGHTSTGLRGRIQTIMGKPRTLPSSLPSLLPVRLTPFWMKWFRPGPVIHFSNAPCFVPARRCLWTGCDEAYCFWKKSLLSAPERRPAPSGAVYAAPQHQHHTPTNHVTQCLDHVSCL